MKQTFTLEPGVTTIRQIKRGVMVTIAGEYTFTRVLIPKVSFMSETTLVNNTTVRLGANLTLIMPNKMWDEHDAMIVRAAMGDDSVTDGY